jgi:hypothetical protein
MHIALFLFLRFSPFLLAGVNKIVRPGADIQTHGSECPLLAGNKPSAKSNSQKAIFEKQN